MRVQAFVAFVKDIVPTLVGAFIVLNEELTGQIHVELLVLAGGLLGIPGVGALYSLYLGKSGIPSTAESGSESREAQPSGPSR